MLEISPPLAAEPESALFSWANWAKLSSVASPAFQPASSSSASLLAASYWAWVGSDAPASCSAATSTWRTLAVPELSRARLWNWVT